MMHLIADVISVLRVLSFLLVAFPFLSQDCHRVEMPLCHHPAMVRLQMSPLVLASHHAVLDQVPSSTHPQIAWFWVP